MRIFIAQYNVDDMNLAERICRIIALGLYDRLTTPNLPANINHYVAAGNPGKTFPAYPDSMAIPDSFLMGKRKRQFREFVTYTVSGGSMLPDGICSGYELLTVPVTADAVRLGDYIVIGVDEAFYKFRHHGLIPHFSYKLRRAIGEIAQDATVETLQAMVEGTFAETLDSKELKDLGDSLAEARSFYGDTNLFLSVTYHDGDIHYSFHPSENIRNKVEGVAYMADGTPVFKDAMELAA